MPRYYFHVVSTEGVSADEMGSEFPNVEAAFLSAHEAAFEMSVEMLRERHDPSGYRFEIRDARGELLFDLPFSEVMRPASRPVLPTAALLAQLRRHQERATKARAELKAEYEQARSLLKSTTTLLNRARF